MNHSHTNCETLQAHFSDKLDKGTGLNGQERRHLGECTSCAEFHSFLTGSILTTIATAAASQPYKTDLADSIMARLKSTSEKQDDQANEQKSGWKKIVSFTILAAAAAVAITTTLSSESPTPPDTQASSTALDTEHSAALERITSLPAQIISPESLEQGFSTISQATAERWTFVSTRISNIKSDIEEKANHLSDKFLNPEPSLPQSSLPMLNPAVG